MRQGRIVEQGPAEQVLNRPEHPFTKGLICAAPHDTPRDRTPISTTPVLEARGIEKG